MAIINFTSVAAYNTGKATLATTDTATVTDTAAILNANIAVLLRDAKVTSITPSDAGDINVTVALATSLNTTTRVAPSATLAVVDTAANIQAKIAGLLSNANIDKISQTDTATSINLTVAQTTTTNLAKLASANVSAVDTSTNIKNALANLLADARVDGIHTNDGGAITLTAAQALVPTNLAKFSVSDTIIVNATTASATDIAAVKALQAATNSVIDTVNEPVPASVSSVIRSAAFVDEGSTVTFDVTTSGAVDGSQVSYQITGIVDANDFDIPLTGTAIVNGNKATISVPVKADNLTESGNEDFGVKVTTATDSIGKSASSTIVDTSKTVTYDLKADAASANEGASATFTLTTIGVADGTSVPYTLAGVDSNDIVGGALSGSAVVSGGKATISVALANDNVTEGSETLSVTAASQTASTTVVDTSTTPLPKTYALVASASTVNEGKNATFGLTTTGVADGTLVSYTLLGDVDSADLSSGLSGSVTVNNGRALITVPVTADSLTEGSEVLTAYVNGQFASVAVNDTSVTPATGVIPSGYTLTVSNVRPTEGDVLTFTLTAASASPTPTTFEYDIHQGKATNVVSPDDFQATWDGFTLPAGATTATFSVTVATDQLREFNESAEVTVLKVDPTDPTGDKDIAVASKTFVVKDAPNVNFTTSNNDNLNGSARNETFTAALYGSSGSDSKTTLHTDEAANGRDGIDTLELTIGTATGSTTPVDVTASQFTLKNIEILKLIAKSGDTNTDTIDAVGITGMTDIVVPSDATSNVTVNNVANLVNLSVTGTGSTGTDAPSTITLGYANAVVSPTPVADQTQSVKLESFGRNGANGTIVANGIEIFKVTTATGASYANLQSNTLKTVQLDLGQNLTLAPTLTLTKIESIDTAKTGALTVDLSSSTLALSVTTAAGADSLKTGTGNDTITSNAGNDSIWSGSGNDNVSGGDGDDTVTFNNAGATSTEALNFADTVAGGNGTDAITLLNVSVVPDAVFTNISSVETLNLSSGDDNVTLDVKAQASGLSRINTGLAGNDTVKLNGTFTNPLIVNLSTGTDSIDGSLSAAQLTIEANAGSIDTTDTLKGGTGANDTLSLFADNGTATLNTVSGFEKIVIVDNGGDTVDTPVGTIVNGVALTVAKEFTVAGVEETANAYTENDVTIVISNAAVVADNATLTVDASALLDKDARLLFDDSNEGNSIISVIGGAGDDDVKTGAGNDIINASEGNNNVAAGSGNNTVTTGAGKDTITSGAGADSITSGAGDDNVESGGGIDTVKAGLGDDLITGGAGADQLWGEAGKDTFTYTAQTDSPGNAPDVVNDFEPGIDTISISASAFGGFAGYASTTNVDGGKEINTTTTKEIATNTYNAVKVNANAATDFGGAQGAVTTNDGIIQAAFDISSGRLYIDVDDSGSLNLPDINILIPNLKNVTTGIDPTDIGTVIDLSAMAIPTVNTVVNGTDSGLKYYVIKGGEGADKLIGSVAAGDSITGASGNDSITDNGGDNTLNGGAGNDVITAGAGNDTITGDAGSDSITTGGGNNIVTPGNGVDTVNLAGGVSDKVIYTTVSTGSFDTTKVNFQAEVGDTVSGFATGTDKLQFSAGVLNMLDGSGTTAGSAFTVGGLSATQLAVFNASTALATAVTGSGASATSPERFILNGVNGNLYLDVNGDTTATAAATPVMGNTADDILVVTLTGVTTLATGDFVLV